MNIPFLFVWLLVPLLLETGRSQDTECLKVMTFNIRYGTAPDGDNSWPMRRELLMKIIRDESPDLLGLQEALRSQIDELRRTFPEYGEVGVGRDDGKTEGEYSSILYRQSILSALSDSTFWFSDTPVLPGSASWGNRYPRICTWALFRFRTSGDSVAVYNVHLDHESQPSREQSTELLVRTIEKTSPGLAVVAMGDFNAGEQNPAILRMKDSLRDSFRELHPDDSLVGTFHAYRGTTSGEKIDHIFVNSLLKVTKASILRTRESGRYPSDHYPVTATVCFTNER